uniref:Uncharacterized protein n=1 Tax=Rhizophora mucronata TaxID=61149 RepID=A0A2P2QE18_RHIMU
MFTKAKLLT